MEQPNTPRSARLHIGLFGRRNAGKSSLINALTGQRVSLVSDVAGTTTDPVFKAMELHGFGPVTLIDTAGLDDEGELGALRIARTRDAAKQTDLALLVLTEAPTVERDWAAEFKARSIPALAVLNKSDLLADPEPLRREIEASLGIPTFAVSAADGEGVDALRRAVADAAPDDFWARSITGTLAEKGDLILLVMPQDSEAPKGRLIAPQVQTIRELLDKKCAVMCCAADALDDTLACLARPPKLIITDSQAFGQVYPKVPQGSLLTSFSILFAGYKGDVDAFLAGARALDGLTEQSRVLIAEACTHAPIEEDIGRVKIPKLLRKKYGDGLTIDFVRGGDFPEDLTPYDLVIHCGACMFPRRYVLSRLEQAQAQRVPMCNYGVVLAALNGILDKVCHA
jgi:[FeFe] hydrogenase H-cluster maturation GTPase HydF